MGTKTLLNVALYPRRVCVRTAHVARLELVKVGRTRIPFASDEHGVLWVLAKVLLGCRFAG